MNAVKTLIAAVIASTTLSGCVIAIHDRDVQNDPSWKERQTENREYINQLSTGVKINQVTDALGGADDTEGFEKDGKQYVVLYYRTQHRRGDGNTTRDETTPLVFENGRLVGWGHAVLDRYFR